MTISSLSSTGYYFGSANSSRTKSGNPLQDALSSLETDLQSGDTSDASSVLSNLLSHGPKAASDSSTTDDSSSNPADKVTNYLKTIQQAVSSGDTSGAQTALASLQDFMTSNPPPKPPNGGTSGTAGTDGNNPLQKALSSLASDLTSGDTTDASSILSDIIAHTNKSAATTSSTDRTDSTSATTSFSDDFSAYLKSLSSAISTGDTSSAQSILASFEKYLQANQPSAASGTYAANGDFTSTTSSGSSISALA
jgi:hypothetical protein